jgi:hypothetical protein
MEAVMDGKYAAQAIAAKSERFSPQEAVYLRSAALWLMADCYLLTTFTVY